ncbi:conserved Plasmodium protein, unknown function [Plasmodium knowlesi strain H]|uniref:Uncharacterized protein n=3 Tax=Plasmodium knowlesi TaxID=5850 RepID=A0A5K1V6X7_PLAKH|nr:conserved Plasmodium protein, unknown function [Plasmodium knowlesi strain H]OTN64826.1 Uncharacterized protein PKNOH_S120144700 [Plasmodium knowlesi]CAA9988304.1 conserved Plasmodium protein, unknown function [Plasmodium knowlesi strain H]SBO20249.1 conserved Plasmodium protein, unknown function [Plasmodium knowlesi strain H]SBO20281.1 conserved Plasmodium protein, unknown function [Plasmodium knowlesi strain H]VVS77778.1 conserved Plasmodium protein, unknown function [Plasmodium knowlesi |eukprot:XP_002259282.1 hypothetical protein, conserved in Plasmodium species [Plasmodium knowlesi strain H]
MIKKEESMTLSTEQGGDHTKCEDGKRESNDNYREFDSTNSVGCEGAYNSDICEDDSTCASSIGKSVYIINASFSKIKKNLHDINEAIHLHIDSEGETGDEFSGELDDQSDGTTISSDDSSIVKTFNAYNGNRENVDGVDDDDHNDGEDRKRSKELQLLLNNVINTKLEKKKIATLDIIDECISIKKHYNSIAEKRHEGEEEDNCAFVVDGVPRGISYAQSVDMHKVENLDDLLEGMAACEAGGEAAGDFDADSDAPPGFDMVNLKDPGAVGSEDEAASEASSAEPPTEHISTVKRLTDCLQNFKNSKKYRKDILTYPIIFFLKKEKQLVQFLRRKKKLFYCVLHAGFLLSYLLFCLSFILCKRALYGMFYDQDL